LFHKKEQRPSGAFHIAVEDPSDLAPLTAQDVILIVSASAQEASDLAALAAVLARDVRAPVVHFFDRRWVGGEFAQIDAWDEESLRTFSAPSPGSGSTPETIKDAFDRLCARLKEITGRSYATFEVAADLAVDAEKADVVLASETDRPCAVRVRLWRP